MSAWLGEGRGVSLDSDMLVPGPILPFAASAPGHATSRCFSSNGPWKKALALFSPSSATISPYRSLAALGRCLSFLT